MQFLAKWCEWLGPDRARRTVTTEERNEVIQRMTEEEGLAPGPVYRYCSVLQRTICRIIAWTGLTHEQIRQLRPEHIFWERNRIQTMGRRKGRTAEARVIPVLERGMDALREFDERGLYGNVDNYGIWVELKRAAKQVGRGHIRPYDLRHNFAPLVYETSGDLDGTAFLLNHASTATTKRYALAAFDPVAVKTPERTAARLEERLGPQPRSRRGPQRVRGAG